MATVSHTSFSSSSSSVAAEIRKLSESAFDFAAFKQETELLHLVLYRSRNQHHVSHWWRYFSMLHQHCFRIVNSYERLVHMRARNSSRSKPGNKKSGSSNTSNNKRSNNSGKNLKGYSDYSEGPVWATSKRIQDEAHYLYTKLIPSARLSFHGILRQGAFVTLGLALLGLAARLHALLEVVALVRVGGAQRKKIVERARKQAEREKQEIAAATQKLHEEQTVERKNELLDGVDLGESISRDSLNLGTPISRSDIDLGESVSRDELLKSLSSAAVSRESSANPDHYTSITKSSIENNKEKKKETDKKRSAPSPSPDLDSLGLGLNRGVDSSSDVVLPVAKKSKKSGTKRERESSSTGDKDKKKSKKKSKKNAIDSIFGF